MIQLGPVMEAAVGLIIGVPTDGILIPGIAIAVRSTIIALVIGKLLS
jgi:hypothetical protein